MHAMFKKINIEYQILDYQIRIIKVKIVQSKESLISITKFITTNKLKAVLILMNKIRKLWTKSDKKNHNFQN